MIKKARSGIMHGYAPVGYKNVRLTLDNTWIEVDEEEAMLVRRAFQLATKKRRP